MKKIIFLSLVCLLAIFAVVNNGRSQTKTYYSGDSVSFNNQLYVGTTNMDSLEVFKLENSTLTPLAKIRPFNSQFGTYGSFYDMKFSVENNQLFVYAISDFSLYKYEVANNSLNLVTVKKNTYWEWYTRVDKFGDNIVTMSSKGVKIWNSDLEVITGYYLTNPPTPYNIHADNSRFILNINNGYLTVFDRNTNSQSLNIPLNYKDATGNRRAYQDNNGQLYAVDDYNVKKFSADGKELGVFKHSDFPGYDVASSGTNNYIYFSNGLGVTKMDKNTMKSVASVVTTNIAGAQGWAMGMDVVNANGDKVVIFNNANILVLDANLNKLASVQSTEEKDQTSLENLYLNLDHNFGAPTATVNLNGGGYFPNEKLTINFGGVKTTAQADNRGRFTQTLTVPSLPASGVDIKVDGQSSNLTYSIAFKVTQ